MANDAQIEKTDYLLQYSSYLCDIRDSTIINVEDILKIIDEESEKLRQLSKDIYEKYEGCKDMLRKMHEMQEQKNPADVLQYQKMRMIIEKAEEVYKKMNKSFDLHEENCSIIQRKLSELSEQSATFKNNITTLMETDIDVVKKSIEIIERYKLQTRNG